MIELESSILNRLFFFDMALSTRISATLESLYNLVEWIFSKTEPTQFFFFDKLLILIKMKLSFSFQNDTII